MRQRTWSPASTGPAYDLHRSLRVLGRGPYDPAFRLDGAGAVWRTTRTPTGPATLRLVAAGGRVTATGWGAGADWVLDRLPALLGADDRPEEFTAHHRVVREAYRRHAGVRLVRTGLVLESLIPSVLEQKVTADEAYRAWRRLLRRFGEVPPGPVASMPSGMAVLPDRRGWLGVPSWEWHRAGVDARRSATIMRAVRVAPRLEEAAAMPLAAAQDRLRAIPGVGPWTAAEVVQRSNGEPDAVTTGDLHLPGIVGHALADERDADDARMLELLEPYRGQRHRATRLIMLSGRLPRRRAPRMPYWDIARL